MNQLIHNFLKRHPAKKLLAGFFLLLLSTILTAQNEQGAFYLAPEILLGKTLAIHSNYPKTKIAKTMMLSIGRYMDGNDKAWANFYHRPFTGFSVSLTDFGNKDVFGYGLSVTPYITLHSRKLDRPAWHWRLGLGAYYYTTYFDSTENPTNKSVGGPFSWSVQFCLYRDLMVREKFRLQFGGGWLHGSNGHTALPNFGINTMSFGFKTQFYKKQVDWSGTWEKAEKPKTKTYFLLMRLGIGLHELGGPDGPVDGPIKEVYATSFAAGMSIKRFIRVRAGFGYRYYQHYHDYIIEEQLSEFLDHPHRNASNVYISAGAEFLLGHFAVDAELGTNLYKPFFGTFFDIFENKSKTDKILKSLILQRLGLYYYLWDTSKVPPFNIGAGVHINANNGQADFTGFSLMMVKRMGTQER